MTAQDQGEPIRALRAAALAEHTAALARRAEQEERDARDRYERAVAGVLAAARRVLRVELTRAELRAVPLLLTNNEPVFEFSREALDFRGRRDGGEYIVELRVTRANDGTSFLQVGDLAQLGSLIAPAGLR